MGLSMCTAKTIGFLLASLSRYNVTPGPKLLASGPTDWFRGALKLRTGDFIYGCLTLVHFSWSSSHIHATLFFKNSSDIAFMKPTALGRNRPK